MKQLLLMIILFLGAKSVFASQPKDSTQNAQAPLFNYYFKSAQAGNAKAMNRLAVLYLKGLGVKEDDAEALKWFKKSTDAGYAASWYNLGMMYKNGVGTSQDYIKAYTCFKTCADLNNVLGFYGQGFFLYKGIGCQQNYAAAFKLFFKGAALNGASSMYMIGLCYRNGYGVPLNIDSATYWLQKSSRLGYKYASDELAATTPENEQIASPDMPPSMVNQNSATYSIKNGNGYQKVKHDMPNNHDIDGEYVGYSLKFDYSGKKIIKESTLKLILKRDKKAVTALWEEDGSQAALKGDLSDSGIVFKSSSYQRTDHYNTKLPNEFAFQNASLKLTKSTDTVMLTGSIQLYSTKLHEPEKPTFILLMRAGKKNVTDSLNIKSDSLKLAFASSNQTDSVHFVAYPNPFNNKLQASYILKHKCNVTLIVTNLLNGSIVYKQNVGELEAGSHSNTLYVNGLPGTYVFTLNYGTQLKSQIIFKQ